MEETKRLILPAIVAIMFHGVLVNYSFPLLHASFSVRQKESIQVEISSISLREIGPEKHQEQKPQEAVTEQIREPVIPVKNEPVVPAVPAHISGLQKKIRLEPELSPKNEIVQKKRESNNQAVQVKQQQRKGEVNSSPKVAEKNRSNEAENSRFHGQKAAAATISQAKPKYLENRQPQYPEMARRRGYEGEVLLNVLVAANGSVADISVKHSSGHAVLDKAAMEAVRQWLFVAATISGQPVTIWVEVPIIFQLKGKGAA